ncbi:MAG: ABC transporter substrate-binding protein [Dehalococcoidia bacterium]|nr:ABC transporter substrate-binding protein [Dehalococcoidia bacterium]
MRSLQRWLAWPAALALLAAACNPPIVAVPTPAPARPTPAPSPTPASAPVSGGALRVAVAEQPPESSRLDPHEEPTPAIQAVVGPVYSGLVQFDPAVSGRRIIGDLAEDWRLVDDLTFEFSIRKDATFHNGQQVTAVDVLYSLDRVRLPPRETTRPRRELYASIKDVIAPDRFTLRIIMRQPDAGILSALASGTLVVRPQFDGLEETWRAPDPVGSGPFVFTGYSASGQARYPRYKDYFLKGKPYLDYYELFTVSDATTRIAGLRAGLLDVVLGPLSEQRVRSLREARPDLVFHRAQDPVVGHDVVVNTTRSPFNDLRVRKALRLALDDEAAYVAQESSCGPYIGSPGGLSPWALPQNDLAKRPEAGGDRIQRLAEARKLVADAGLSDALTATVLQRKEEGGVSDPDARIVDAWAKLLAKGINDIGGKAEVQELEAPKQSQERLLSLQYDIAVYPVPYVGYPDPNGLSPVWRSGAPRNYANYADPELDRLLAEQARTLDWAKRLPLVYAAQQRILDSYAAFYLPRPTPCDSGGADAASQPWVKGFQQDWAGARLDAMRFDQVWIDPVVKGNFKRP